MIKECPICKKQFNARRSKQMYCSHDCQVQSMRKDRKTGVCLFCGKTFTTKRASAVGKYCSHQCQIDDLHRQKVAKLEAKQRIREKRQKEKEALARQKELAHYVHCNECNKIFYVKSLSIKYCSPECKRKHYNRIHDHRLDRCEVKDSSITLHKLYDRDGGVCKLCGTKLSFTTDSNDNLYPSIDHIKPISKGGQHTWDNVQLLCRRCNYLKKDSLL